MLEGIDGALLTPGSPAYDAARRPENRAYADVRPALVLRCCSEADVVQGLTFARETGMPVVPRGGGHCFAGRSSTDGLLLDLSGLSDVAVDGTRATIGAGARLGGVYAALHRRGRTLPAGCGETVGIAGLTLGGGIGLLGRRYGLTCDRLVAARVVLADGRVVDCGPDAEPDLFWALRGAGGGQFGVVTSLTFDTVAEPLTTRFELRWAPGCHDRDRRGVAGVGADRTRRADGEPHPGGRAGPGRPRGRPVRGLAARGRDDPAAPGRVRLVGRSASRRRRTRGGAVQRGEAAPSPTWTRARTRT